MSTFLFTFGVNTNGMVFSQSTHRFIFLFGLAVSLCALPFSPFALSVGLITLAANWLISGQWPEKYSKFIDRKSLWAFLLIYFSAFIGLFYSDNIGYAIKELRLWLPILLVPIVVGTTLPINKKEFKILLLLFCTAVFVGSLISFSIFIQDYSSLGQNIRYISSYISHIRFALMVDLSIFSLFYLAIQKGYFISKLIKLGLIIMAVWLIAFLFILQSITGIGLLIIVGVVLLSGWIFKTKEPVLRFSLIVVLAFSVLFAFSYIAHSVDNFFTRENIDFSALPRLTVNGNPYSSDTLNKQFENGNLVWINICYPELKKSWERVRNENKDGVIRNYKEIEQPLIRYLASKGLLKDSIGFAKLDSIDISLINNNVSSVIFKQHKFGIYPRLYQILWEIDHYNNFGVASGSSIMQRYLYLKASWQIIKENLYFGVGTGDGKDRLMEYYRSSKVNLEQKYWLLSHNQYLTVWIGSGVFGLVLFLVGLFLPVFYEKRFNCVPCVVFMVIVILSMLSEDTFETHIGVSFAAIFYSIFFFGYDFDQDK